MPNSTIKPASPAEHFGAYLKRIREEKAISLKEVAAKTKISVVMLRHLEAADLAQLPAEVFVRGFVQAYANAVRADAKEARARLGVLFEERQQAVQALPKIIGDISGRHLEGRSRVSIALVVLLILIVATLAVSLLLRHPTPATEKLSLAPSSSHQNSQLI